MKRKLIDEVTVQEMQHMREEGLTNKQIAERLDCNYITVKRYLGKQPEGMRAAPGTYSARVKDVEKPAVKVVQSPKTDLVLTGKTEIYQGQDMTYTVKMCGNYVRIRNNDEIDGGDGAIQLGFRELENFILELIDLRGRLENA